MLQYLISENIYWHSIIFILQATECNIPSKGFFLVCAHSLDWERDGAHISLELSTDIDILPMDSSMKDPLSLYFEILFGISNSSTNMFHNLFSSPTHLYFKRSTNFYLYQEVNKS